MAKYNKKSIWDIPYLTIDPEDIGKKYQAIIRINSQSGKGGVAYILESVYNCVIPKNMQPDVAAFIQKKAESTGTEISPADVWTIFNEEFVNQNRHISLEKIHTELFEDGKVQSDLKINYNGMIESLSSTGNGPIDASKKALTHLFPNIKVESYSEHSLSQGSDSKAICYMTIAQDNKLIHGVGIDNNITLASVKALFSALNRSLGK